MSQNPRQSVWRGGYPLWLVSDTAFELTSALVGFVIPLLALMVTDDPALAGIIGGVGLAVRVVASLVGGVLADRHSRVLLMVLGALVGLLLAAVFTALTVGQWLTFSTLLALNVGFAVRNGLFGAPNQAALKDVVPDSALGRAQAANQGRDAVIGLGGAPLGGLLLGIGAPVVGVAMILCQAVAAASASVLSRRVAPFVAPERAPDSRFLRELSDGFRWVFSRPDLKGSLVVSTLVNLGFNASIITIIYSLQQAGSSPATIGLVSGGLGVGMLLGRRSRRSWCRGSGQAGSASAGLY
ncbi:MFS transporter [Tessaracoccus aquimaris]|uniref:MFS transporter n=1 Tax=Tessaracoccus aquimaris TaxID=1332264 RepID=UPI0011AB8EA0|nr:MFS transporter [Tessaracoccus aquimaris]